MLLQFVILSYKRTHVTLFVSC